MHACTAMFKCTTNQLLGCPHLGAGQGSGNSSRSSVASCRFNSAAAASLSAAWQPVQLLPAHFHENTGRRGAALSVALRVMQLFGAFCRRPHSLPAASTQSWPGRLTCRRPELCPADGLRRSFHPSAASSARCRSHHRGPASCQTGTSIKPGANRAVISLLSSSLGCHD